MASERPKIRWAPKLRQELVWQLYQADAKGLIDEDLIDKAGYALLSRCHGLRMVLAGEVRCPVCGRVFVVTGEDGPADAMVRCPGSGCTWWTTREEYRVSHSKGDFIAHRALPPVQGYIEQFGQARSARERMMQIDRLIHAFHWDAKADAPVRAVGNNLIEGKHWDVVAFLDRLSLGAQTRPDAEAVKQEWRRKVKVMAAMQARKEI
jgi:hypothetical protein